MAKTSRDWKAARGSGILFVWQDLETTAHEHLDFECRLCVDRQVALRVKGGLTISWVQGLHFMHVMDIMLVKDGLKQD